MNVIVPVTESAFQQTKKASHELAPEVRSAHRAEIVAAGFGFASRIAMKTAIGGGVRLHAAVSDEDACRRAQGLGYHGPAYADLVSRSAMKAGVAIMEKPEDAALGEAIAKMVSPFLVPSIDPVGDFTRRYPDAAALRKDRGMDALWEHCGYSPSLDDLFDPGKIDDLDREREAAYAAFAEKCHGMALEKVRAFVRDHIDQIESARDRYHEEGDACIAEVELFDEDDDLTDDGEQLVDRLVSLCESIKGNPDAHEDLIRQMGESIVQDFLESSDTAPRSRNYYDELHSWLSRKRRVQDWLFYLFDAGAFPDMEKQEKDYYVGAFWADDANKYGMGPEIASHIRELAAHVMRWISEDLESRKGPSRAVRAA